MIDVKNLYKNYYPKDSGNFAGIGKPEIKEKDGVLSEATGISFNVSEAELFGLIGPDGAGKTTIFRILTTLILPDKGMATLGSLDVVKDYKEIRKRVGYMPGRFSLYQDLTVLENLEFFATVFDTTIKENYDLIKDIYIQIEPFKNRRAGKLSGGMKQKLALCCALIHKPEILFLDEPTTGVDPVSRKEFWGMLQKLKAQGITILVSTPYMDEAALCDRIGLIQDGNFLNIDTPDNIVKQFDRDLWSVKSYQMHNLLVDLRTFNSIDTSFAFGDSIHFTIKHNKEFSKNEIENLLISRGHDKVDIHKIDPGIEDCFMELSKKQNFNELKI